MSEETQRYVFKGVWIPKEIWEAEDITWMEKCLLAEISALDNGTKGCNASNDFLARKFSTSPASIANQISKLRKLDYIQTVGFDGRERRMKVTPDLIRRLKQGSLESLVRFHHRIEALIEERKAEPKAESEAPMPPVGDLELEPKEIASSIKSKAEKAEDGFAEFWQAYPNKKKKDTALRAWKRKNCSLVREEIMLALAIQKGWASWLKGKPPGQFIPHPASWLNGKSWEDEESNPAPAATPATKKGF